MDLRNKLRELINSADYSLLESIDTFIEKQINNESVLSNEQWSEIDGRRSEHLEGKGRSYKLKEFKELLSNRHGL